MRDRLVTLPRPGVAAAAGLVTLVLALVQLIGSNPLGMSDNGDFVRLLRSLDLQRPPRTANNGFVTLRYAYGTEPGPTYGSSALLPLRFIVGVPRLFGADSFDIRWLSAVYAVALAVLVWFCVRALPDRLSRAVGGLLLVVVTTDSALLAYFGSFYSEPVSLLALLLVVGVVLRIRNRGHVPMVLVAGLAVAGVLLATVKTQNVSYAVVLAVLALLLRPRRYGIPAAVLMLVVPAVYLVHQPAELRATNLVNAVFYTAVPAGGDPAQNLRELGIDPALARFSGQAVFGHEELRREPSVADFGEHGGYPRLVRYYLRHPDRALGLAVEGTRATAKVRPDGQGNRTRQSGAPAKAHVCEQCLYSTPSRALGAAAPVLLPALHLGAAVLAVRLRRRRGAVDRVPEPGREGAGDDGLAGALGVLAAGGLLQFGAVLLGEGRYEIVKHLYLVDVGTAVLVVLSAVGLVRVGQQEVGARAGQSSSAASSVSSRASSDRSALARFSTVARHASTVPSS